MHNIEPYYLWIDDYNAAEDEHSPFFGRQYSEFRYTNRIYDHMIHPQWDDFGSETLFLKILYVDYQASYAILEFIGEWNDAINNDIMLLKTEVVDVLSGCGVDKFMLIGENVLNFHASDDCYYEEWFGELDAGWIAAINFRDHVLEEMKQSNIDYYINFGGDLDELYWRKFNPRQLFQLVDGLIAKRLNA
ncbi:MAG: hypothetical protein ACK417_07890 [Bacteroidia bacterium]